MRYICKHMKFWLTLILGKLSLNVFCIDIFFEHIFAALVLFYSSRYSIPKHILKRFGRSHDFYSIEVDAFLIMNYLL